MSRTDLEKKHDFYSDHIDLWNLCGTAYDGGLAFIKMALQRHPRESLANWEQRIDEGMDFNYVQAIVDLFNFYLTEKLASRNLGGLEKDEQWQMFEKDADLNGTNLNVFINNAQKLASIYGHVGILVNKFGGGQTRLSVNEEIRDGIYPYCAIYTPPNIYDWSFRRNPVNGRPQLEYLKLKEGSRDYLVWEIDGWEHWRVPDTSEKYVNPILVDAGEYHLGEIPFVWMRNVVNLKNPLFGNSDIGDISRVVMSIIRNFSCGDEIIKYAGFPMMRMPMSRDENERKEDVVGNTAVLEFNPEDGDSAKPDWLEAPVQEPVDAILKWTDRKTDEIYRIAHLSGVHGQRKSNNEVASGLALRYEFQQLNAVLGQKSTNMTEAELSIIRLWLSWQLKGSVFQEVELTRQKSFSLDELAIGIENAGKVLSLVPSEKFFKKVCEAMVKSTLNDLSDSDFEVIKSEIEKAKIGQAEDPAGEEEDPGVPGEPDEGSRRAA
jgi:hypothetical protein